MLSVVGLHQSYFYRSIEILLNHTFIEHFPCLCTIMLDENSKKGKPTSISIESNLKRAVCGFYLTIIKKFNVGIENTICLYTNNGMR